MSQSSTVVGTGQDAPQASVIAQSACSCISTVSFWGGGRPRSDADLAHHLDDLGQISPAGLAGRLRPDVHRRVALEQGLGHLRTAGVVGAHEQDVLHALSLGRLLRGLYPLTIITSIDNCK